jgi:acyl-CoA reductase-like NAD-dependent aldehyde dehydrogenase
MLPGLKRMNMSQLKETGSIPKIISQLRSEFQQGITKPLAYRQKQLAGLRHFLIEREKDIEAALYADLKKSSTEAFVTEISVVMSELRFIQKKLASWVKPKRVYTNLMSQVGKSHLVPEPLGLVLIIAPWNYPIQLTLSPLIGAIAAGNCVVIKPSELAPATSQLLARCLPDYLDPRSVQIIEGGVAETSALLAQIFDYIFYTGNGTVGRIILEAAARHLTPVSLELGGKCPCIVDKDVDLALAAKRIAWGKFLNAGQTCVAPDYLLVQESREEELIDALIKSVLHFYGNNPQSSPDYSRIISKHHHQRLKGLIPGSGDIVLGGNEDETDLYLAPTILRRVPIDAPVMKDEIFGPILPIIPVADLDEAIHFVNARPKPLSLYCFTDNKTTEKQVTEQTSSGSLCINHVIRQLLVHRLPFGGVGDSGMGAYHGKASFDTFSHDKSVLKMANWFDLSMLYPPYTWKIKTFIRWLTR